MRNTNDSREVKAYGKVFIITEVERTLRFDPCKECDLFNGEGCDDVVVTNYECFNATGRDDTMLVWKEVK